MSRSEALGGICLLFSFSLPLPVLAASERLNAQMGPLLKSEGLQGAVWATLGADGAVVVGAAGVKNATSGAKMRPDDRVHVGSVAKTLLATGVLRLVSEGRLALNTPVAKLLPDIVFENRWAGSDPVRLRHLLDHTSGLDDARFSQIFSLKSHPDTPLSDAFIHANSLLRIRSRPGDRCSYSNMGYALLGRVMEAVTGERYEQYLETHLLRPLGMRDSSFFFVDQKGDPRLAMGHVENGVTQAAVSTYLRPAGQFTTTAADMGRLAGFLMGDGMVDGKPFIASRLLDAMGRPHGTEAANRGLQVGYGLGLGTRDRHGAVGKCHGGSTVGFRAMFCLFPQQRQAFFISVNADSETADYGRLDELMVNALTLRPPSQAPAADADAAFDSAAWKGYYIPAPNRFASMALLDTALNFAHLRQEGTSLRFKPFQSNEVALNHVGGALFRAKGRVGASHALLTASTGERVISTGTQSYEKVSLLKLAPLWISLIVGLLGLAYILVCGLVRVVRRRLAFSDPLFAPLAGIIALLLPLPLFHFQSFLQLGELTLASGALAAVTVTLPLTMLAGLAIGMRQRRSSVPELAAMLGVLQLTALLLAWGMLPFRLWA